MAAFVAVLAGSLAVAARAPAHGKFTVVSPDLGQGKTIAERLELIRTTMPPNKAGASTIRLTWISSRIFCASIMFPPETEHWSPI